MANFQHIGMILLTNEDIQEWQNRDPENNILDLSDADFSGQTISDKWLAYANLENANFSNAILRNVQFGSANLKNANFEGATLERVSLVGVEDCSGIKLKSAKFVDTNLSRLELSNLSFEKADFSYTSIRSVNFESSDFKGANFYETIISDVIFKNSKNLHKAKNIATTNLQGAAKYFEFCERNAINRFVDWEVLRVLGKLPIFGASYIALITIPIFFYLLSKYNEHVNLIKSWALKTSSSSPEYIVNFSQSIISNLEPIAVPQQSLLLLLSTILLAFGATLYTFFCPSRIKEFSRDQWVDQLGQPLFHYWPLAWRFPTIRVICLLSYLLGGLGVIWVIGGKLLDVGVFIFKYA